MATYRTGVSTYTIQQTYFGTTGAALDTAGFAHFGSVGIPGAIFDAPNPIIVLDPAWLALDVASIGTTYQGAVSLSATATLTSDGVREQLGGGVLTATASLSPTATQTFAAAVSLTSTTTLTSDGIRT